MRSCSTADQGVVPLNWPKITSKCADNSASHIRNCDSDSGGGREAGGRQERRDEGNWAQEWGRVETGGLCRRVKTGCREQLRRLTSGGQW